MKPFMFHYSTMAKERLGDGLSIFEAQAAREIDVELVEQDGARRFGTIIALGDDGDISKADVTRLYCVEGRDCGHHWHCRVQCGEFETGEPIPDDHPVPLMRGKRVMMPRPVDAPGNDEFLDDD